LLKPVKMISNKKLYRTCFFMLIITSDKDKLKRRYETG
jgi:hypothetical protein